MRLFESEMASCKSASSSGRIASDPPPTQREGASPGQGCGHPLWLAVLLVYHHAKSYYLSLGALGQDSVTHLLLFWTPFFCFPRSPEKTKGNVFFLASSARHDVEDGFILTHAQAAAMRQPPAESHPVSPVQTQWQSSLSRLCTELRETAARRSATLRCSVCRCGCSPRARPWPHCVDP